MREEWRCDGEGLGTNPSKGCGGVRVGWREDRLEDERGEATNPSNRLRPEDGAEGGLGEARTDGVRGVGGREGE